MIGRAMVLVLLTAGAARGQEAEPPGSLELDLALEHGLAPSRVHAGAPVVERLTVVVPEGAVVVLTELAAPGGMERLGARMVTREPEGAGMVRWTFTSPWVAWSPGMHRTPERRLSVRYPDRRALSRTVNGDSLWVVSPIPLDSGGLHPSDPGLPRHGGTLPPLMAVLPALLAVGSGLVWWGEGRRGRPGPVAKVAWDQEVRRAIDVAASSPADSARALAEAARFHPGVVGVGGTTADTTGQLLVRLTEANSLPPGLREVLTLADAVKFGGLKPAADEVVRVGTVFLSGGLHA